MGAVNHTLSDAAKYALFPVPVIQVDATTLGARSKVHPRTYHEGPEGSGCVTVLFL